MAGVNTGVYSTGSALPPKLETLMNRYRKGYAQGGVVPPAQPMPQPMPMPQGQPGVQPQQQAPQVDGSQIQGVVGQLAANPQVMDHLKQVVSEALQSGQITPDQLNLVVETAKACLQNPQLWPQLRQMLIQRGIAGEQELPPNFDKGIIFSILMIAEAAKGIVPAGGSKAPVGNYAVGGSIPQQKGDPSGTKDNVPINVSGGEYVIPKHVVAAKGTEFFDRMLEQYDPNNPDSKVNKK